MEMGKKKARAIADACEEIALPKLLIMLSILAVFVPAFFMTGVPQGMFLPLSMAVGFSMIAAFLLSQTLVPILSNWVLKVPDHKTELSKKEHKPSRFDRFKDRCVQIVQWMMKRSRISVGLYVVVSFFIVGLCVSIIGKDILPKLNSGQFQIRIRAPEGSRLEQTEKTMLQAQQIIYNTVGGQKNVEIISAFAGQHPSSFPTLPVILFMSASNEIVMQVNLDANYKMNIENVRENLRIAIHKAMPEVKLSFEPIDLTSKIMSQGSSTPVEIAVMGININQDKQYADLLMNQLQQVPFLRDVQLKEQLNSPAIHINIDRDKVKQMGLLMTDVSNCITQTTSSSRFTNKDLWLDEGNANSYDVQVEVPQTSISSIADLTSIPIFIGKQRPVLGDVCTFTMGTLVGQYDRQGPGRFLSIIANIYNKDLGSASAAVSKAIKNAGTPPRGVSVEARGLTILLDQTLSSLQFGLMITIVVLMLMLTANYQSFPLGFTVITTIPGVLVGSLLILLAFGSSLNLQSYMGIIMSVGVSVSNAILLITNAEHIRLSGKNAMESAIEAMELRLRPILMTTIAMIAGMIPMASGLGEAGDQTAPLGRAVIGGLILSTFVSLFILPVIFYLIRRNAPVHAVSLDPDDQQSIYYDPKTQLSE
jgi:multidrug efflux pump subunit AcrB